MIRNQLMIVDIVHKKQKGENRGKTYKEKTW